MSKGSVFEKIYEQVKRIPYGRVATYGQIALLAGNPRWARAVGYALHTNPNPAVIKCHRVVNRNGGLSDAFAFGGKEEHARRLKEEGIEINANGCVNLKKYGVLPEELL